MKVAVGVESQSQGELVLQVLSDLKFANLKLNMANVIEVWEGAGVMGIDASVYQFEGYLKRIEDDAKKILRQLHTTAESHRMSDISSHILYGHISNELLHYVDKHECDLLALGSFEKGPIEGILEGSVGRKAIINCAKSVLIAKDSYNNGSDLSVVLATDHSPAANQWIDHFIAWAPRGIQQIHVVAVIPEKVVAAQKNATGKLDLGHWIQDHVAEGNHRVLEKLAVLDVPCYGRIEIGDVGNCLAKSMADTHSKLLIMGSQGHGFLERVAIGSVSLEQAIKRPFSVLVVRV